MNKFLRKLPIRRFSSLKGDESLHNIKEGYHCNFPHHWGQRKYDPKSITDVMFYGTAMVGILTLGAIEIYSNKK
jgi:hypothetical protein